MVIPICGCTLREAYEEKGGGREMGLKKRFEGEIHAYSAQGSGRNTSNPWCFSRSRLPLKR